MPTPTTRFADKANLKELFAGLKAKYESKDPTIVHDAGYVHTDENYTAADKAKLDGIDPTSGYSHPTHPARTGKPTADQAPAFGASFTVSQVTSDGYGHVTGMTDRDVTMPSATATTASAGLMSATDKAKLDGIEDGATGDPTPVTDAQVDAVSDDGSVTSDNVLTGTGLTYLWSKLKAKFAALAHTHAASDITSGTLPIANGGTGANTAAAAAWYIVNRQDIAPASVAATGEVSAWSGSTTHKLTDKAESSAIAYVESATATQNHAVGDYFMLGGTLMVATSAIAAGESITTSNATAATLFDYAKENRRKMESIFISTVTGEALGSMAAGATKDVLFTVRRDHSNREYRLLGITGIRPNEPQSGTAKGAIVVSSYYAYSRTNPDDGIKENILSVRFRNISESTVDCTLAPQVMAMMMLYEQGN